MTIRELGDDLILRRATPDDVEAVAEFDARVLSERGWDEPDEPLRAWVKDMMSGRHPIMTAADFLVVEDTATGAIVSSTSLISQTWSYAGIPFGVGRPEVVGTHPDYRRRGLVRAQFDVLHAWSAERGHLVQGITGIPWYYRQYGYEMALDMHGGRRGPITNAPELEEDQEEPFRIRPATPADLDVIAEIADYGGNLEGRLLVNVLFPKQSSAIWPIS
ncbi:MAG: GNAT family N-acetyltransferase [Anaerolineae bacterium]